MQQLETALKAYSRNSHCEPQDEQITELLPIVRHLVQRAAINLPRHYDVEFLVSAGVLALVEAVRTFDPARGAQLKTYAYAKIRGAILDELRGSYLISGTVRRKVSELTRTYHRLAQDLQKPPTPEQMAEHMNTTEREIHERFQLSKLLSFLSTEDKDGNTGGSGRNLFDAMSGREDDEQNPRSQVEMEERRQLLAEGLKKLSENERLVVALHYYEHLMLREIGLVLNVTESRVCQLHTAALLKLEKHLKSLAD